MRGTTRQAGSLRGFPSGFWWLWSSTLVNRLGTFVFPFLTLYLTTSRGYSATGAGLVLSVFGVGSAVGALAGGELTDRVGRRVTMVGGQVATAAATAVLGLVAHAAAIAALAFAVGAASSISRPAVSSMIADLVGPADRLRAFAVNYWAINIGFGLSTVTAGFLAQHGYLWLFLGDAATTLACAMIVWVKLAESRPAECATASARVPPELETAVPALKGGARGVLRDSRFMALTALAFVLWVIFFQGSTSLPLVMARHGLGSHDYGLVIGLNGLLIVALQIPLTRFIRQRSMSRSLAVAALLIGGGFGLDVFAGGATVVYALTVVVWTLGEMVYAPAASAAVAGFAPRDARGRYQGVFAFSSSAASCVAPLAGGLILDYGGPKMLWGLCALLGAAAALAFLMLSADRRDEAAAIPPTTGTGEQAAALPGAGELLWEQESQ